MGQNWTVSAGTYKYIAMDVYFEEKTQSIEDNATQLYWAIRAWDTSGSDAYWYSQNYNVGYLTIDGTSVFNRTGSESISISIGTDTSASKKKIIASGTIPITHNTDGSKECNIAFELYPTWNKETYDWNCTKTLTLTNIPRASSFTISDTSVNFGDEVEFTITRASSNFTHTLKYTLGSASGTIASDVATSASWTISKDLMKQVTKATNGKITITCETYSGSELIGSKTSTITAYVPSSIIPTLDVKISEGFTIPSALAGIYIQGYSKLKVTSSGAGQYGATIKSYTVTVESKNYSGASITTSVISGSGDIIVKAVVTDSRGRTATKNVVVSVLPYNKPRVTKILAYRVASSVSTTEDKNGEYIYIKPSGTITSLSDKNEKKCIIYYKKAAEDLYSNVSMGMNDYKLDTEYVIISADAGSGYDIYVELSDSLDKTKYIAVPVLAASAYIHVPKDRRGIGLGKRLEGTGMEVGWDIKLYKQVYGNVYGLGAGEDIASNSDFNNILITGNYAVKSNNIASTISNIPIAHAGRLLVSNALGSTKTISDSGSLYLKQEYISYYSGEGRFERDAIRNDSGTWTFSNWHQTSLACLSNKLPDALASLDQNVLWSGYLSMTNSDTITLTEAISKQRTGIELVFVIPGTTEANDYGYVRQFVSKKFVSLHSTKGSNFWLSHLNSHVAYKYLYITDTTITGNNSNTASGTASNGITYNNAFWKLRYVIGV